MFTYKAGWSDDDYRMIILAIYEGFSPDKKTVDAMVRLDLAVAQPGQRRTARLSARGRVVHRLLFENNVSFAKALELTTPMEVPKKKPERKTRKRAQAVLSVEG